MIRWLALGCIFVAYVIWVVRLHPANFFGLTGDDSVYFSSAKALAEGRGYVLPSVPGSPPATKFPIFYPWMLSWVWRWNPSFPANLSDAVAVSVIFGLSFLTAGFVFLRRLEGISETEALFLTAFCAFHPLVVFYSGSVLSEIPFCALALGAMLVANQAMRRDAREIAAAWCGVLAGLSMVTRVFGLPVAAGILMAAAARRAGRQALIFCGCAAPFFAGLVWRVVFPRAVTPPVAPGAASSMGWSRAWVYYTNYAAFWRISVPTTHILWAMLKNNAGMLLRGAADYFLQPMFVRNTLMGKVLITIVTAGALAGMVRQARRQGWQPIHCVLPFYAAVILFWNYPDVDRFFLPFLPLFAAGVWIEGKHVFGMIRATMLGEPQRQKATAKADPSPPFANRATGFGMAKAEPSSPFASVTARKQIPHRRSPKAGNRVRDDKKIAAMLLGLIIVALSVAVGLNYVAGTRVILQQSEDRAGLLREKREAYDWIVRFTPANARVIAYEDASTYLYTGRVTMRPLVFSTAEFYEPARLGDSLASISGMARAIGAEYWLFADDDFDFEWAEATAKARSEMSAIERGLPLVFRSRDGRVRIHSLSPVALP